MVPNQNPKLQEHLDRIWRESQERLIKKGSVKSDAQYIDLTHAPIELEGMKMLEEERSKEVGAVIFEHKGSKLAMAVLEPKSSPVEKLIAEFKEKGFEIILYMVSKNSLKYAQSFYKFIPKERAGVTSKVDIQPEEVERLKKELTNLEKVAESLTTLFKKELVTGNILNVVLAGALTNRASDIHFETSKDNSARLRYRIDGVLQTAFEPIPKEIYHLIVSRIKLLSNLRLNVSNVSQDGRFTLALGDYNIELRIAIAPSEFGEAIVMRVLDPKAIQLTLPDLGFRDDDLAIIKAELKAPNGMVINTGPTGSGKTTSLYAFLRTMTDASTKIITIEDPIEYHLPGIEQTQVDNAAGYTFANGLRSMMRQDPDMILVGEIRDEETVDIAIQAALTGHLVFSTLHTNSAAGAIPRLTDLKAPLTSIGPALNLIIAQRLVRRLCKTCKVEMKMTPELKGKIEKFINSLPERVAKPEIGKASLYQIAPEEKRKVCEICNGTGYKGRIGIFELLRVGEEMEELINKKSGEGEISRFARGEGGMVTMQQDGILRVMSGDTDFTEVEEAAGSLEDYGFGGR